MAAELNMQREELRRFLSATITAMQTEAVHVPPAVENIHILADIGKTIAGLRSLLDNLTR